MATLVSENDLREHLAQFDGKAVSFLSELRVADPDPGTLIQRLADVLGDDDPMVQRGASWLLLDMLKTGSALTDADWHMITPALKNLTDWQAALHLLQIVSLQTPPTKTVKAFAAFLNPYLSHKRPFLRAWSLSALKALASKDPSLRKDAEVAVQNGLKDQAASVRARAKKLI